MSLHPESIPNHSSLTRTRDKILIANRGEISVRISRAAKELGIPSIAIYSHEDRFSDHHLAADEAYQVGGEGEVGPR